MDNSRIYYVNSESRLSGTNSRFAFPIQIPPNSGFDRVVVLQASIPLSYYLVQDGYNKFILIELGVETEITIPQGNYNVNNFMASLKTLLNTSSPNAWVYNITFDILVAHYTFTVTGNSGQPAIKVNNHMYQQFGFNRSTTNTFSGDQLTSINSLNFIPESTLYIHSDIVQEDINVLQEVYSNNTIPYSQITYKLQSEFDTYSKKLRTTGSNVFNFYLTNEEDEEMYLNGQHLLLTILLYKKDDFIEVN